MKSIPYQIILGFVFLIFSSQACEQSSIPNPGGGPGGALNQIDFNGNIYRVEHAYSRNLDTQMCSDPDSPDLSSFLKRMESIVSEGINYSETQQAFTGNGVILTFNYNYDFLGTDVATYTFGEEECMEKFYGATFTDVGGRVYDIIAGTIVYAVDTPGFSPTESIIEFDLRTQEGFNIRGNFSGLPLTY